MDRMLEEGTVNEEKKPVPARKLEYTRTGAAVSLENAQGIDFAASQLDKRELIMDREMAFNQVPFFMRMRGENQDLSNKHLAKPSNVPGKYIRPKDYLRLGQTYNSHFQIHNNLKVVSGQDLFFSDKVQGLMHVNMQSASMAPLLSRRSCVAMDMYNYEYLAVVEDPNTCHFVHLETNRVMKSSNFQLGERELVNTVQFLDDRSGSLKVALGANADILQVFDVETEGEAVHSFRVPYNVNYLCFDKEGKTTALGYDGKPVDLFDFRSGKRVSRLEGHTSHTFALDYHPSNNYLASGNEDQTVRIWDLRMMKTAHILPMNSFPAGVVKYTHRGDMLIVGENQHYVHAFDTVSQYQSVSTLDFFGTVIGLDLSPDQRELYVGVACDNKKIAGGILRASIGPQLKQLGPADIPRLKSHPTDKKSTSSQSGSSSFLEGFKLV